VLLRAARYGLESRQLFRRGVESRFGPQLDAKIVMGRLNISQRLVDDGAVVVGELLALYIQLERAVRVS
jgi:hypothetical protein